MALQLAPSKDPEKESKLFALLGLISGVMSLFLWFVGIAAIACSARGIILSKRVGNKGRLAQSIVGLVLGLFAVAYYYINSA